MTSLQKLQNEVGPWVEHNFGMPEDKEYQPLLGIGEELGELNHAHLKMEQGIRGATMADIEDALGDMLVYMADYCNRQGIDLQHCLDITWDTVKVRDWKPDNKKPPHPMKGIHALNDMTQAGKSGD